MRLITLDEAVQISSEMFDRYVEHVGISLMSGEVPSVMFSIHRRGTKDKDWLAQVRFKNTLAISIFRCEVYLEDVFRLCRQCKLYLVTREVFRVAVLYAMLHPLYQSQFIYFKIDIDADYESMMASAGVKAYGFMRDHFTFECDLEREALEIIEQYVRVYTNRAVSADYKRYECAYRVYVDSMLENYQGAYQMARFRKAQTMLIDEEGFMLLETKTEGGTTYYA